MLSNAYKDYLEDFLWQKAANLVRGMPAAGAAEEPSSCEDAAKEQNAEQEALEQKGGQQEEDEDPEPCVGLHNFSFHVTLLLMLLMQLLLNSPSSLAWVRNRR